MTGEKKRSHETELESLISSGKLIIVPNAATSVDDLAHTPAERAIISRIPLDMRAPAAVQQLLYKVRWIKDLEDRGAYPSMDLDMLRTEMLNARKDSIAEDWQFKPSTIKASWMKYLASDCDARVLLPAFHCRGGAGQPRVDSAAEALLQERLKEEKGLDTRLRVVDVWTGHKLDVAIWNRTPAKKSVQELSYMTVSRRFHNAFTEYEVMRRNVGKKQADRAFRQSGARLNSDEPMGAVQFDDTDGEVFLIDDVSGLPWGRANVTVGIDEYTQSVTGKELSHKSRDTWSAIAAFVSSILPKDMTAEEFELCKEPWHAYGAIGTAQFDNATYNHSPSLIDSAGLDAGAIPGWSKPRTPTNKWAVEHFNNMLKTEFTPAEPGWRGPKRERDGLSEGPGSAVSSLQGYRKRFNKFVCDKYSNSPLADGFTSRQNWQRYYVDCRPLMPIDTQGFRLICTLRDELTFRASGGLLRLGLRYQSPELHLLQERLGSKAKVLYRIHPFDLSRMYVFHPTLKVFLIVPCIEIKDYINGLTNYQQQLIVKLCRERGQKNPSIEQCEAARQELRKMALQLRRSKKLTERKRGQSWEPARTSESEQTREPKSTKQKTDEVTVLTDLESQILALDQVSLEDNADGWVG